MNDPLGRAEAALAACRGLVDTDALTRAIERWRRDPWRVVVVGRIGAGKTSLVNAWCHGARPVGLGGVTRAPEVVSDGLPDGVVVVDTQGIDAIDVAVAGLEPLLADADAIVWVTDGLQPMTATERAVIDRVLPAGVALHLVVSRAELLPPEDRLPVLDRVRRLGDRHQPRGVRGLDLRRLPPRDPDVMGLLDRDVTGSPRRRAALRDALVATAAALDATPAATDAAAARPVVCHAWRQAVRDVEARIDAELTRGERMTRDDAARRFARAAPTAIAAFLATVDKLGVPLPPGRPELPAAETPSPTPWQTALGALSGRDGARRGLRAAAARFALEGEAAIAEWLQTGTIADGDAARRAAARAALAAAIDTLAPGAG